MLRARVRDALAGAGCWQEFGDRLSVDGVLVRARYSTIEPGEVTGYAVALRPVGRNANDHRQPVWYGGRKPAPELTFAGYDSGGSPAKAAARVNVTTSGVPERPPAPPPAAGSST